MRTSPLRIPLTILVGAIVGCASPGTVQTSDAGVVEMEPALVRRGTADLRLAMRSLWTDHVVWTRQYIVAASAGDGSEQAASRRLLKNQEDIGNAIAPYYGSAAGAKLTDLLKQHILIAVDVVSAAKAGDDAKLTDADRRWHDNAGEIATFLSGANPHWPRHVLLDMLNQHLTLTTQEATARLQRRWDDEVRTFDRVVTQAMSMADALAEGIAKQFPDRV